MDSQDNWIHAEKGKEEKCIPTMNWEIGGEKLINADDEEKVREMDSRSGRMELKLILQRKMTKEEKCMDSCSGWGERQRNRCMQRMGRKELK